MAEMCPNAMLAVTLGACREDAAIGVLEATRSSSGSAVDAVTATFSPEVLRVLPGGTWSQGADINAAGDVAGSAGGAGGSSHPVSWHGTAAFDLGIPFGTDAWANSINDLGAVTGLAFDRTTSQTYGFVWNSGVFTLITDGGFPQFVQPFSINSRGEAVGRYSLVPGYLRAFRWTENGGIVDLHPAGAYIASEADAINDAGTVAGTATTPTGEEHFVVWSSSNALTDLGTVDGGTFALPTWINNAGTVIGRATDSSRVFKSFVWRSSTGFQTSVGGIACSITDRGRIVGWQYTTFALGLTRGPRGSVVMLPLPTGATSSIAYSANSCGHIAGYATNAAGVNRGIRWRISACD